MNVHNEPLSPLEFPVSLDCYLKSRDSASGKKREGLLIDM